MENQILEWDEATFLSPDHGLERGILSLLAFSPDRSPQLIGTAFIIEAQGKSAVAMTAAHNLEAIRKVQNPYDYHHASALPEFLGSKQLISLKCEDVRAIYRVGDRVECCPITWALSDLKGDLAALGIKVQDEDNYLPLNESFLLDNPIPKIGDEVCLLGYADMNITDEVQDSKGFESFKMSQRLILRRGKITRIYDDKHTLRNRSCIQTSIPVFGGVSGSPLFMMGESGPSMKPFALISSDSQVPYEIKYNRSVAGDSIAVLLDCIIEKENNTLKQEVQVRFENANLTKNP